MAFGFLKNTNDALVESFDTITQSMGMVNDIAHVGRQQTALLKAKGILETGDELADLQAQIAAKVAAREAASA